MNTLKFLAVAAIALIGCGDNKSVPDARVVDASPADAYCSNCPAAPTLGAQIDRMGRAAVNTVLNHGFDADATAAQAAKKAYNENDDVSTWVSTATVLEFAKNLALIDVLDTSATATGCGNQALYNGGTGTTPAVASYHALATMLANDQLFLDTGKSSCTTYLAVEAVALLGSYSTCGGRAPGYDVVDYSYSMLAAGLSGFTTTLMPLIKDGAEPHDDYLTEFPYLGPPNQP